MSRFDEMIARMKAVDYREKRQFLEYLAQMPERARHQFSQEDKDAVLAYAYEETEHMLKAIPEAATYKEKDLIFECEDFLLGIVMHLTGSPDKVPGDKLLKMKALAEMVNKARYLENALDSVFQQPAITETDVNRLLYWARQSTDEYHRSKLLQGLAHYRNDLSRLNDRGKQLITDYIAGELRRLMALEGEDIWNALELIADVSKYFADEAVIAGLKELLKLGRSHINFYAVDTLCSLGCDFPREVVGALARDLEYAGLTYSSLQRAGKADLFPAEYTSEEYLAKSDLVRWLCYPTELGQAPEEIEYIGKIKQLFKKEVFHVFKFRSCSDNLGDELKGKWLVGWSSNEGGTFSNFDEFAPFENEPTEKALKLIKKKLIG